MKQLQPRLDALIRFTKSSSRRVGQLLLKLAKLFIKQIIKCYRWLDKPHTVRIKKKTIIIGVLILYLACQFLIPKPTHIVYAGTKTPKGPAIYKIPAQKPKLPQPAVQPVQPVEPVQVAPVSTPAPNVQSPTDNSAYSGTGDPSLDWIVSHESGGNPYAINASSGACGLFQALPCSKLGCSLSDIACQIAWGKNYVISAYGSSYAAMLFWQAHNWY